MFSTRVDEISVEGYTTDQERDGSFRLHGLEVDLSKLGDEDRRELPRVDAGIRVRVSGRLQGDHSFAALRIDIEDEESGGWMSIRARSEEWEERVEGAEPRELAHEEESPAKAEDSDGDSGDDSDGDSDSDAGSEADSDSGDSSDDSDDDASEDDSDGDSDDDSEDVMEDDSDD